MMPIINVNEIATPVVVQCLQLFRKGVNFEYTCLDTSIPTLFRCLSVRIGSISLFLDTSAQRSKTLS